MVSALLGVGCHGVRQLTAEGGRHGVIDALGRARCRPGGHFSRNMSARWWKLDLAFWLRVCVFPQWPQQTGASVAGRHLLLHSDVTFCLHVVAPLSPPSNQGEAGIPVPVPVPQPVNLFLIYLPRSHTHLQIYPPWLAAGRYVFFQPSSSKSS